MLLIIRIRSVREASKEVMGIFRLFRLRKLFTAVFMFMDEKRENLLRRIEKYVTYGIPNKKTISELIFKRGYLNLDKKRVALQTNELIEQAFGEKGIICL